MKAMQPYSAYLFHGPGWQRASGRMD